MQKRIIALLSVAAFCVGLAIESSETGVQFAAYVIIISACFAD